MNNLKLIYKGLILVSVPLVFEVIFIVILGYFLTRAEEAAQQANSGKAIVAETGALGTLFYDAGYSLAAYKAVQSEEVLKIHEAFCKKIKSQMALVSNLLQHHDDQKNALKHLQAVVDQGLNLLNDARKSSGTQELSQIYLVKTLAWSNSLLKAITEVIEREKNRESFEPQTEGHFRELVRGWLLFGLVLNIVLAVSLAIFFNKGTTHRLSVLLENLKRFSKGEELLSPVSGNDEIVTLDLAFRDMALALKEARREEQAIIENADDVICSITINLKLKAMNSASAKHLGYSPEELLDSEISDLLVDDDKNEWNERFIEIVNSKENGKFESRLIHKTGRVIDVWWSMRWSEAEQCMFCVIQDNSERKVSDRIKQETMNMVSHDLRSPLTSIQFSLDKFGSGMHGQMSEGALKDIAIAKKNVNQLMRLINYLLDVEKLASGKMKARLEQISVDYMVSRAIESLQSWASDRNIVISYAPNGLLMVGDIELLTQVLINLISNAIKFSPEQAKINVEASTDNSMLTIKVMDQGSGISELQKRSFSNHLNN